MTAHKVRQPNPSHVAWAYMKHAGFLHSIFQPKEVRSLSSEHAQAKDVLGANQLERWLALHGFRGSEAVSSDYRRVGNGFQVEVFVNVQEDRPLDAPLEWVPPNRTRQLQGILDRFILAFGSKVPALLDASVVLESYDYGDPYVLYKFVIGGTFYVPAQQQGIAPRTHL